MLFKRRPDLDELRQREAGFYRNKKMLFTPAEFIDDVTIELGVVYPSSVLLERLPGIEKYIEGDPNPESVDMPITRFYKGGTELGRRDEVLPHEIFVGYCPIRPIIHEKEFLCLEGRSNVARTKLDAYGFAVVSHTGYREFSPFIWHGDRDDNGMYIFFANRASVPYVMDKVPCAPFQVSLSERTSYTIDVMDKVRIKRDGKDVSDDARSGDRKLPGYMLTLAPEISFMEEIPGARIRYGTRKEDAERLFRGALIDDVGDEYLALPSLTISNEHIHSDTPAYVFPFHVKDMYNYPINYSFRSEFIGEAFLSRLRSTITGNSGLHHIGSTGRMVFENTPSFDCKINPAKARDYFRVNESYGLLIPVPLAETGLGVPRYRRLSGHQKSICINDSIERN
jgi:hypothetical protein